MNKILFAVTGVFIMSAFSNCVDKNQHSSSKIWMHRNDSSLISNSKYYYDISNEIGSEIEYNDKKVVNNSKSQIRLIYTAFMDSLNHRLIRITYDDFHINLKENDVKEEIFASKIASSEDAVGKMLAKVVGMSLIIQVNSKGDIMRVDGGKEIVDKILGSMNTDDEATKKKINEQIFRLVGDDFIKNTMAESFKLLPDSSLNVGDTWKRSSLQSSDIRLQATTKYTLTSLSDGIAEIEAESEVKSSGNTKTKVMGMEVLSNINGTQTGEFKIDEASGTLLSSKSETSLEGTIQVLGRDIPIKIKMKKEITGKKI